MQSVSQTIPVGSIRSAIQLSNPNGVYPRVLDVHSRVSRTRGSSVVEICQHTPESLPLQPTNFTGCQVSPTTSYMVQATAEKVPSDVHSGSFAAPHGVYPDVSDVHYRVSRDGEDGPASLTPNPDATAEAVPSDVHPGSFAAPHDVYTDVSDVHYRVSRDGEGGPVSLTLNPDAMQFVVRDPHLIHRGVLRPDLGESWDHVQRVQAGCAGDPCVVATGWGHDKVQGKSMSHLPRVNSGKAVSTDHVLPFHSVENINDILGTAPKQVYKVNTLRDQMVKMPGRNFIDKLLPAPEHKLVPATVFTPDYFVALHNIVAAPGYKGDGTVYGEFTPNHLGARIALPHVKLKIDRWRYHLTGYENAELVQHIEFGFPLGLQRSPNLESTSRNHGSAYSWYGHVDKFVCKEVTMGGMTGPFKLAPWWDTIVSPLMTAHKKPRSRRTVFDATFGDNSLNNATPSDVYMGQPCQYTFPKIEDYRQMILQAGPGAHMWKRDLSRFFLQLPLDPAEYRRVAVVWRGMFFFFTGLAFGLRHSGLNGQKVTDAVTWILRGLGQDSGDGKKYGCCNYVDDIGGVEHTKIRAEEAYQKLGWLLGDLGLEESHDKAEAPTTRITYLGVQFDSMAMTMSVPPEKLTEIKAEIRQWLRRTTICKKELQSLLGKLFWVAKVVTHSRVFMGRLLTQLRAINGIPDHKKVKLLDESRKDILWWAEYLEKFNGINMMVNDDPIPLSFEQLLDSPFDICAGDATPTGGGAWHGNEYWSQELPAHLQDTRIPIHIKEFWVMVVSAKQWGSTWTGRCVVIYCDNDAVVETVQKKKPKDAAMLSLLREFLFVVVTHKFYPVVRKIGTKENELADFVSRRFDPVAAAAIFSRAGLNNMQLIKPNARFFDLSAKW